jgi:competence protein ComEC
MIRWIPYTFIRITFVFICGILSGIFWPQIISVFWSSLFLGFLIATYLVLIIAKQKPSVYLAIVGLGAVFVAGYLNVTFKTDKFSSDHLLSVKEKITEYQVVITGYPEDKGKNWKVAGEISKVNCHGWRDVHASVLLYFDKISFEKSFVYGDRLLIRNAPQVVQGPSNPHEFDYQKFLSYRNIYHQQFIKANDAYFIDNDPPSVIVSLAMATRAWSVATLKKFIDGADEQAIACALVLGVTDGLDHELLSAYSSTGSMHVLAVSGLHISIIYWIILLLLKPLDAQKRGKVIVSIISLLVLWSYAFVTGLSPSVLRAVTMFTFLEVARVTSRDTNIFNTLSASAFCLLLLEPFLIMSVGFQLSYLAVLGIVYIHPMLFATMEPKSWLANEIRKITSVSIAAQLATFPLGLLYFHQFPNYFLISNLLVIPISFGVLIFGLIVLATAMITSVASLMGYLLALCIKLMNMIVQAVDWMPFSVTDGISITVFQCCLLVGFSIALVLAIQHKRFHYFVVAALSICAFFILQFHDYYQQQHVDEMIVYRVPGHSAFDLISEGSAGFSADSALLASPDKINFHIKPNRIRRHADNIQLCSDLSFMKPIRGGEVFLWKGKTILYVKDSDFTCALNSKFDFVVIANNSIHKLGDLAARIKTGYIILDSSNSFYYASERMKEDISQIKVHSVLHDGAFRVILKDES